MQRAVLMARTILGGYRLDSAHIIVVLQLLHCPTPNGGFSPVFVEIKVVRVLIFLMVHQWVYVEINKP